MTVVGKGKAVVNFLAGGTRVYARPDRLIGFLDADDPTHAPTGAEQTNRNDSYLSVLLKLVPAEVVSVYMAIRDSATQHGGLAVWFFACLAVCLVLRAYSSLPKTGARGFRDVQWAGVAVSCVGFFLWAYAIGADPPIAALPLQQWLASALAALLSLLAPIIVPGDASAPSR